LGDVAIEQDLIGNVEVLNCQTRGSALQAVLDGKADGTYVYTYTAQSFVNSDHTSSLKYSMVGSMSFDFKIYVRSSCDHELITILNKCIGQMPSDAMNQLITAYTANTPENMSFGQYLRAHPGVVAIAALLAAAAMGVIIALYLRSRWNKKLLHTTELANQNLEQQLAVVSALSRDYLNVYAINAKTNSVRVVKLTGYVPPGLEKNSQKELSYTVLVQDYINNRVYHEDREYLTKALELNTVVEKLSDSTEYSGSYRVQIDGEIHIYQFTCATRLEADGNFRDPGDFFLVGFRNIDEVVRRDQEQKAALETALAEAQRANIAKTTFLNSMSHDIRTPMNAIIGFTNLAVSHMGNQGQVEGYLGKILTSSKHLLSLINDILDMSRIESGKVRLEEKEVFLPEVIGDLQTIVQADMKEKQISLSVDMQGVTNETVICDKLRLNQVLLNILSNAIKYTGSGGAVGVCVTQTDDVLEGYGSYRFRIKDTGIGMSPEFLEHVFEPFEREQTSTVSGIQGTGLGLAITKNIVDMMNGTITVTSEVGVGSEFVVSFCFKVKEDSEKPDGPGTP
ncbi:MAG: hypothetical protein K2F83_02490, partial [Oscillospiraceae bacterium]|nr:hypothetical protein [Oscillospiraceae bacterium]